MTNAQKFKAMFNFQETGSLGTEEEVFLANNKTGELEAKSLLALQKIAKDIEINKSNWKNEESLTENEELCLLSIKAITGIQAELPANQLEMVSGIFYDIDQLITGIKNKRAYLARILKKINCEMLFAAAPKLRKNDLDIFPRKRYQAIAKKQGEKIAGAFIAALHIHFGVSNSEEAIYVLNEVNQNLLEEFKFAYSDARMSKYIEMVGKENLLPPHIKDWEHYFEIMKDMDAINDPTKCWWLIRINPVGTVELRIADVWEDVEITKAIITKFTNLAAIAIKKNSTIVAA